MGKLTDTLKPTTAGRLFVVPLLLSLLLPGPLAAHGDHGESGVDGVRFVAPGYGWAIEWDAELWSVENEVSDLGYDGLQLATDGITVYLEGYAAFEGDAAQCVYDTLAEMRVWGDIHGLREEDDLPPPDALPDAESILLAFNYVAEDEPVEVVDWLACQTLVDGEAVMEVTVRIEPDFERGFYDAAVELFEELLAELDLSDVDSPGGEVGGVRGVEGDEFVGPVWGVELKWDPADWLVEERVGGNDEEDVLKLSSEDAYFIVLAFADYDGDPDDCVEGVFAALSESDDIRDLEVVDDLHGPDPARGAASLAVTYDLVLDSGDTAPILEYTECRTLVDGEAVLELVWQVKPSSYEAELPLIDDLLAAIEHP